MRNLVRWLVYMCEGWIFSAVSCAVFNWKRVRLCWEMEFCFVDVEYIKKIAVDAEKLIELQKKNRLLLLKLIGLYWDDG